MKVLKLAVALAFGSFVTCAAHAAQICPVLNGGSTSGGGALSTTYLNNQIGQNNQGCNVLITFNANGSIVTTNPNGAISYDSGGDDNLIGILNLTGTAITSINLSSAGDIFGVDGDGACQAGGYTAGGVGCTGSAGSGSYAPTGVTFSNQNAANTSGTVNFATAIAANGGSAFFSLEGPVDINLAVNPATPEPNSLILLGTGILGLGGMVRRKLMA